MRELVVLKDNDLRIRIVDVEFRIPRHFVLATKTSIKRALFLPRLHAVAYIYVPEDVTSMGRIYTNTAIKVYVSRRKYSARKWTKELQKHDINLDMLEEAYGNIISEALRDDSINRDISTIVKKKYKERYTKLKKAYTIKYDNSGLKGYFA